MPGIGFEVGFAVGVQTGLGSINTTIRDLVAGGGSGGAGEIVSADGALLGDPSAGVGESGISVRFRRELREKAKLGNFTLQASDFLREAIEGFALSWAVKGNGVTIAGSPTDADYLLLAAHDALLQGLSLGAAGWGGGNGQVYTPAPVVYLTGKLWLGRRESDSACLAWVFEDMIASGRIVYTPEGIAVATADLSVGNVAQFAEETFPTFDYGTQASESAPVVEGTAFAWGASRGFTTFELAIANEVSTVPDSNKVPARRQRVTDRTITARATLHSDDADLDFERAELVDTVAPVDLMSFRIGSPAGQGDKPLGHQVRLTAPELRSLEPVVLGDELGWSIEVAGTSDAPNGELELIFD